MSYSETCSLINTLSGNGLTVYKVNDGEDTEAVGSFAEAVGVACSVDEAHLYVRSESGPVGRVYIVHGNGRGELVCDYAMFKKADLAEKTLLGNVIGDWSDTEAMFAR